MSAWLTPPWSSCPYVVHCMQELFRISAEEGNETCPWSFSVSMMEIYNEAVRDLLALAATGGTSSGSSSASSSNSSSPSNSPPGPHAVLSSLDVSGLPAGEVPPHMDRWEGQAALISDRCFLSVRSYQPVV